MTKRKDLSKSFSDIEKPHETVAESFGDDLVREPLSVRLGDLWSDFVRGTDPRRDPDGPARSPAALRLLDDMKGIVRWD